MADDVIYKGTLTGSDGTVWTINDARLSVTAPAPATTGPIIGSFAAVRIGGVTYPLAAVNPTDPTYPGGRGPDQLVAYQAPLTVTATNQYGAELVVADGKAGMLVDRLASGSTTGTVIPTGTYVLSGHGKARDFLLASAKPATAVELTTAVAPGPSGPTGAPGPVVAGSKVLAVYLMMWSGHGTVADVPAQCNQVRLAFAQGSPPKLVGTSSEGLAQLVGHLAAFRARGGQVLVSVGGAGGAANIGDHAGFVAGIVAIRSQLGGHVDGIDWDLEAVSMNTNDAVAIGLALKQALGASFKIVFTPNGGNVSAYLPAAVACQRAGCLDGFGQQFYDAPVSAAAALGRVREAINAGIPAGKITIGMMIAADASHWTIAQCVSNYQAIKAAVPNIGGAYLWELSRSGTAQWAQQVGPLVTGA